MGCGEDGWGVGEDGWGVGRMGGAGMIKCLISATQVKAEKVKEDLKAIGESPPLFDPLGEGVATSDPTSPTTPTHSGDTPDPEGGEGGKKASDKGGKAKVTKVGGWSYLTDIFIQGGAKIRLLIYVAKSIFAPLRPL